MSTLLVLDCYYLAHRAFYSMGDLSYGDVKTGVVFGFFKDIVTLMETFETKQIVFCFDAKGSKRKEIFPDYKKKRHTKELTSEEEKAIFELKRQIVKLREDYLPKVGYKNVFWADGYEADDVIATTVLAAPPEQDIIIVGADKDLWQLIGPNVRCYNPDKMTMQTLQSFTAKFGIPPRRWAQKLSIAGCKTDEVPGIPGVGETTAIKYIKGTLPIHHVTYQRIVSEQGARRIARNKLLVRLPFADTPTFPIRPDSVTEAGWEAVTEELGMKSLSGKMPMSGNYRRPRATRDRFPI